MAERAPPPIRPGRLTRAAASAAGVRQNLFQSHRTRRPTPADGTRSNAGAANPNNNNNNTTGNAANSSSSSSGSLDMLRYRADVVSESSEIVIRDKNGEFDVGDPPTPPLDDPDEEAALDDAQENERERQRLAEAVRHHQMTRNVHPEEVLEALRASMRAKVAALAEDNWMYEPEEPPHVH